MPSLLIVDDSATARLALRQVVERDPDFYVIGEAACGSEALALARRLRPSVVTMDVVMQHESGIDIAASIMAEAPCPIVIVTACDTSDPKLAYHALQAGALELAPKLPGPMTPEFAGCAAALLRLLRSVAKIPVVTRRRRQSGSTPLSTVTSNGVRTQVRPPPRLLVIGASTGGPPLLRDLLAHPNLQLPIPIAVAQHISHGFGRGFAEWLRDTSGRNVVYVDRMVPLNGGSIYVAPDDADLAIEGRLYGVPQPSMSLTTTPSVDVLFRSAAACLGPAVISLVMTGMGHDGSAGISDLARAGACVLVQDPKTCVVSSMPEAALREAPGSHLLAPADFSDAILRLVAASPASS